MATRNITPRADGEGNIGTSLKTWLSGFYKTLNLAGELILDLISTPSSPASGKIKMYFKSNKALYTKDSSGTERLLTDGSFTSMLGTGLLTGGEISINGDNTKFDIAAGSGYVVDNHTDPENPVITHVVWSAKIAVTPTFIATSTSTNLAIDINGDVFQQVAPFTIEQSRDYIILGRIAHSNLTIINLVSTLPRVIYNASLDADDVAVSIGVINVSGNEISANGANLFLNKAAGVIYRLGSNYTTSKKNPNIVISAALTAPTLFRSYRNGSGGYTAVSNTAIDPNNYDDGSGTLAAIPSGKWTIQRIHLVTSSTLNVLAISYGQAYYDTHTEALNSVIDEAPNINPNLSDALLKSFLIIKQGNTDLSSDANAVFLQTTKLGDAGRNNISELQGPLSSVDEHFVQFNGTSGKAFKDGGLSFDVDALLTANSDFKIASQKAVKTYIDNLLEFQDVMIYKGAIDCSLNPNYPAADTGHTYKISVAGKIGGLFGPNVEVGDVIICTVDGSPSGTHASVGANWDILQMNLDGAVIGPVISIDSNFIQFDGITGKLLKDSGLSLDTDGTLAANSDTKIASQKATKTYADGKIAKATNVTAINDTGIADNEIAIFDLTNKTIKTSDKVHSTDGTLASNSDSKVPTEQAVKTYADTKNKLITYNENLLAADVSMVTPGTFYDGPSLSLVAGTYYISGTVSFVGTANNGYRVTAKLWDETTVESSSEAGIDGLGGIIVAPLSISLQGVIVLGSTTTIKISATSTLALTVIKAATPDSGSGNNASRLTALKIA